MARPIGGDVERTRRLLVAGAAEAFMANGLSEAAMEDVAAASGMTRRTLYRYFASKEALAYEVTCMLLEKWNRRQEAIFNSLMGSGLEKLGDFLRRCAAYLTAHEGMMRYMAEFDFLFRDKSRFSPDSALAARYGWIIHESDASFVSVLAEGVEDGSIDPAIDLELTAYTISNILWAYGQRLATRKRQLRKEFGMSPMRLVQYQIELYVSALGRGARGGER
jgi:AcrR family transcriptional regulator